MNADEFAERFPTLFHTAHAGAWESIRRHGLLSTEAIVDLYDPSADVREQIRSGRRLKPVTLDRPDLGPMIIRDQLPLKFLKECVYEDVEPQAFLDALNGRVFFWLSEERLARLLNAKINRDKQQLVLHIDTAALLSAHEAAVELASFNTGSAHVPPPNTPRRGPDVFVPLAKRSYDDWRSCKKDKREPIVEFTVPYAVPDAAQFVRRAELRHRDEPPRRLYP